MSTIITFEITAKEGMEAELLSFFTDTLGDTRSFEGCINVNLHTEEESPGTIFMYEEWESKEAYQAYIAWRGERGDMDKLMQYVESKPVNRFFKAVG